MLPVQGSSACSEPANCDLTGLPFRRSDDTDAVPSSRMQLVSHLVGLSEWSVVAIEHRTKPPVAAARH